MMGNETVNMGGNLVARWPRQLFVGQNDRARLQHVIARNQRGDGRADPAQDAIRTKREIAIWRSSKALRTAFKLGGQRLLCSRLHSFGVRPLGLDVGSETESFQLPDIMALDDHVSGGADFCFKHGILSQAPHKHACPAVYKAFRQPLMQRIGQSVLYFARLFLPVCRIGKPSRPVRHESPGTDLGHAMRQGVDFSLCAVGAAHLFAHIIFINAPSAYKIDPDRWLQ